MNNRKRVLSILLILTLLLQTMPNPMYFGSMALAEDIVNQTEEQADTLVIETQQIQVISPGAITIEIVKGITLIDSNTTSISIQWNTPSNVENITKYHIYMDNIKLDETTVNNYTAIDLEPNTTYSFKIVTEYTDGSLSEPSSTLEASTKVDSTAPSIPTNLTIQEVLESGVTLTWVGSTDDVNVSGYKVYKNGNFIDTVIETTYTDLIVSEGTVVYRVSAVDSSENESALSEEISTILDFTAPESPVINGVYDEIKNEVSLTWDEVTDNIYSVTYQIYRDSELLTEQQTVDYVDTTITRGTAYRYTIIAIDEIGNSSVSSNVYSLNTISSELGPEPTLTSKTTTTLELNWFEKENAIEYEISYDGKIISTNNTSIVLSDLTYNTEYEIKVRTIYSGYSSQWSVPITVFTEGPTDLSSTISANTVLTAVNSPYTFNGRLHIPKGVKLTIEPGVTIIAGRGTTSDYASYINVEGELEAIGLEGNPIIFTTYEDTGEDIKHSDREVWAGIKILESGLFVGEHVFVKYGGGSYSNNAYTNQSSIINYGTLNLINSKISNMYGLNGLTNQGGITFDVQNCEFENNFNISNTVSISSLIDSVIVFQDNILTGGSNGLTLSAIQSKVANTNISTNTIRNTKYPIYINLYNSQENHLSALTNNLLENNEVNKITLYGTISNKMTLPEQDYYIPQNITVKTMGELIINSGVNLYLGNHQDVLNNYRGQIVVEGKLNALGTAENPILMTTFIKPLDDTEGLLTDVKSHWYGILVKTTGEYYGEYNVLEYGGGRYDLQENRAVITNEGKLTLLNSIIDKTKTMKLIYDYNSSLLRVENSTLKGFSCGVKNYGTSGQVIIKNNNIDIDGSYGIYLDSIVSLSSEITGNTIKSKINGIYLNTLFENSALIENNDISGTDNPINVQLFRIDYQTLKSILNNNLHDNGVNLVTLGGYLNTQLTIPTGEYYIPSSITILNTGNLTVENGTKFNLGNYQDVLNNYRGQIVVEGKLNALGTAENPILMTTFIKPLDDTEGLLTDVKSHWYGILVKTTGEYYGEYNVLEYGGGRYDLQENRAVITNEGKLTLLNSTIDKTKTVNLIYDYNSSLLRVEDSTLKGFSCGVKNYGTSRQVIIKNNNIDIDGSYGIYSDSIVSLSTEITGNTIKSKINGIYLNTLFENGALIENNDISGTDNPIDVQLFKIDYETLKSILNNNLHDNDVNLVTLNGFLDTELTIPTGEYYIPSSITIRRTGILNVEPDVQFKFGNHKNLAAGYSGRLTVEGKLIAIGTLEKPIVMSSIHEEEIKNGLTNKKAYWGGITVSSTGEYIGEHNRLRYGGSTYSANEAIIKNAGKLKLVNTVIESTGYNDGIWQQSNVSEDFNVSYTSFKDTRYAIYNKTSNEIKAENNYFNSPLGPSTYLNSVWSVFGEKIYGKIDYIPFLTKETFVEQQYQFENRIHERPFPYLGTYAPTGNYSYQMIDMFTPLLGDTIDFGRTYNSQQTEDGGFGQGWTFNYYSKITDTENVLNSKTIFFADGSKAIFDLIDGVYVGYNNRNKLVQQGDEFVLIGKDQSRYTYNSNGYLYKIEDEKGNVTQIDISSTGEINKITDAIGRIYTVAYESGKIKSITDFSGRRVDYTYVNGKLVQVSDSYSNEVKYSYDTSSNLLSEVRNKDNEVENEITYLLVDDLHRVKTEKNHSGNVKTYTYDTEGAKTTIVDSNNNSTVQSYDDSYAVTLTLGSNGLKVETKYSSNENGVNQFYEPTATFDRYGNKTTIDRDSNGNVIKETYQDGSFKEYRYDVNNNLVYEKDELGHITQYIYDLNTNNLIHVLKPLDGFLEFTGDYTSTINRSTYQAITYDYYDLSDGVSIKGLVKSITNPNGDMTLFTYDSHGNRTSISTAEGRTTTFEYDSMGRKIKEITPSGFVTEYNYNSKGLLVSETTKSSESATECEVKTYEYDSMNRLVKETLPNENVEGKSTIKSTVYTYNSNGKIASITDPEGNTTTRNYDVYGNLIKETLPSGISYYYTYDEMQRIKTKSYMEAGSSNETIVEQYSYSVDQTGSPLEVVSVLNPQTSLLRETSTDFRGNVVHSVNGSSFESYQYYDNGLLKSATDGNGNTIHYRYDELNRLIKEYIPYDAGLYTVVEKIYDAANNVILEKTSIDHVSLDGMASNYQSVVKTLDKDGLVLTKSVSGGVSQEFEYNLEGLLKRSFAWNGSKKSNETEYLYDHRGLVIEEKQYVESQHLIDGDVEATTAIQITYEYDANGNLIKEISADGTETRYLYDSKNNPIRIELDTTNELGEHVTSVSTMTYEWNGEVKTVTDPLGRTTTNEYNQHGQLVKTIHPSGGISLIAYDTAGRKVVEVSPKNYEVGKTIFEMAREEYVYDIQSNIIEVKNIYDKDSNGTMDTISFAKYSYDNKGNLKEETDALENKTKYTYYQNNLLKTVQSPEAIDNAIPFNQKYEYDGIGNVVKETNGLGVVTKYAYNENQQPTSTKIVDEQGVEHQVEILKYDLVGNVVESVDGNGNKTIFEYDSLQRMVKATLPTDSTVEVMEINYLYDKVGNLRKESDSTGKVKTYVYDNRGNALEETTSKNEVSGFLTNNYKYDLVNNVVKSTDSYGKVTSYTYDSANNLKTETIVVSGVSQTTTMNYDLNSNLISSTDWLGNTTSYEYDTLNRLVKTTDALNNVVEAKEYDDKHQQISSIDALNNETTYEYDKDGNLTATVAPNRSRVSSTYDILGNKLSVLDSNNFTTTYKYDYMNRLVEVNNTLNEKTTYAYDLNGNLLTQTDGEGFITTNEYNVRNLLAKRYEHGGEGVAEKTVTFAYDSNGQLKSMVDKKGNVTSYTYDIHGRLLEENTSGEIVSYIYDNALRTETMTDSTGQTVCTFDELGRTISKVVPEIGLSTYTYDKIDGVASGRYYETTTDPKGNLIKRVFDETGRLVKVIDLGETTAYTYYNNGSRESVVYPDGSKEVYVFDNSNQLLNLKNYDHAGSMIDDYSYTYDPMGNQLSKTEHVLGQDIGVTTYTYDSLNRLKTVTEPTGRLTSYEYDKRGNRAKETVTDTDIVVNAYQYDDQNRLTEITTTVGSQTTEITQYAYDANGNQTTTTIIPYIDGVAQVGTVTVTNTYDNRNQLTRTETDSETVIINKYNGDGRRVEKQSDSNVTKYLYESDRVILEVDETGKEVARNVYGINLLKRNILEGEVETAYYYMYNGHGDVVALLDTETKSIAGTYYYDAFGVLLEKTGNVNNNITYAGYQYDEETETYYLNARMYDPKIARFLQEDTYRGSINDPLSLNLYVYTYNNPIKYYDPSGHIPVETILDIASLGESAWSMYKDPSWVNAGFFVWDVVSLLPYVPGSWVAKGGKYASRIVDGAKYLDNALDITKLVPKVGKFIGKAIKFDRAVDRVRIATKVFDAQIVTKLGQKANNLKFVVNDYGERFVRKMEPVLGSNRIKRYSAFDGVIDKISKIGKKQDAAETLVKNSDDVFDTWNKSTDVFDFYSKTNIVPNNSFKNSETNFVIFNKTHKGAQPKPRGLGLNGGALQSHHGLQQGWAKENLAKYGYDADLAPTITIETNKKPVTGMPHNKINKLQESRKRDRLRNGKGRWSSTLEEELQNIVEDLTFAGFSKETIEKVLEQQYKMFDKLGVPYRKIK